MIVVEVVLFGSFTVEVSPAPAAPIAGAVVALAGVDAGATSSLARCCCLCCSCTFGGVVLVGAGTSFIPSGAVEDVSPFLSL